jgi:adenylate kinase family enzyme
MEGPRTFIFFGLSGAGKGTQAKKLAEYLADSDPQHTTLSLSTGVLFREFMDTGTWTASRVKAILDEGGLLPEFLPVWIWTEYLNKHIKDNTEHLILDGVSRRRPEAPVLKSALSFYEREETTDIIFVHISRERAIERLLERGRYDDNRGDIKARLDWFDANVRPAVDYFKMESAARVHDVDGEQSVEDVFAEIRKKAGLA